MNIYKINEVCFQCKYPLICKIKSQDALKNFYKKVRKKYSEKSAGLWSCFSSIRNCNYYHSVEFFAFYICFLGILFSDERLICASFSWLFHIFSFLFLFFLSLMLFVTCFYSIPPFFLIFYHLLRSYISFCFFIKTPYTGTYAFIEIIFYVCICIYNIWTYSCFFAVS